MERLEKYREIITLVLKNHSKGSYPIGFEVETQIWCDKENDHYQLLIIGWTNQVERLYMCLLHFDIKDEKVWIQKNSTDIPIEKELEALGIPKNDIVLGVKPPLYRKFTEYAVI